MRAQGLVWILGGLFLVCGLPLFWVEDLAWRHRWGAMSMLCLGGFALALGRSAVVTGEITLQQSVIRRTTQPRLFWATVAMLAVTGVGVIAGSVWLAFFKPWEPTG